MPSLPTWSDGIFAVVFHPITGSTYLMSPWALVVLDLVSGGLQNPDALVDALCNRADEDGYSVERPFFVDLLDELIRLDYLLEKPGL